ncbi:uncharacterized protein LOC135375314 [Ornithodoros turicata]|uniref:uncharacterized protein LOC135375314 n=1 Tax=Ornithodoros turicata TaxID=34597 RepID=UPI003139DE38
MRRTCNRMWRKIRGRGTRNRIRFQGITAWTKLFVGSFFLAYFVVIIIKSSRNEPEKRGHIVDTSGCQIPNFLPFSRTVLRSYAPVPGFECDAKPSFIRQDGNILFIDHNILKTFYNASKEQIRCTYRHIIRAANSSIPDLSTTVSRKRMLHFGKPTNAEYIKVECSRGMTHFHSELFLLPVLRPEIHVHDKSGQRMNVVILGLDSVSRLNSLRHLQRTRKFIFENFPQPIELLGFNKVGDNSFPNQIALLTGGTDEEGCPEGFYDDYKLIWYQYANLGYRTMFMEETPYYGLFSYYCRGFFRQPTDYYPRPFTIVVDSSKNSSGESCVGAKVQTEMYLNYTCSLLQLLGNRPSFTYTWISDVSHDDFNSVGYADEAFRKTFETLHRTGVANKSLIILISDHGLRYGHIRRTMTGRYEDRLPLCILLFPHQFRDKYADAMRNLIVNQRRLTTPFDIHATLTELVNFSYPLRSEFRTTYGLSLLHEVPERRTCADAHISPHWCSCHEATRASLRSDLSKRMALFLTETINSRLEERMPGMCRRLQAADILDVQELFLTVAERDTSYFWVTVFCVPCDGIFEGTVSVNKVGNMSVDKVSRLNRYGDRQFCVTHHSLEPFCCCKPPKSQSRRTDRTQG